MTDYRCPDRIAQNFDTEELARAKGRQQLIEWVESLPLKRGDRVEGFRQDLERVWCVNDPHN